MQPISNSQIFGGNRISTPSFGNSSINQSQYLNNRPGSHTTFAKTSSIPPFQNDTSIFKNTPTPNLYPNNNPLSSSTKFLQNNQNILNQQPHSMGPGNNIFAQNTNNFSIANPNHNQLGLNNQQNNFLGQSTNIWRPQMNMMNVSPFANNMNIPNTGTSQLLMNRGQGIDANLFTINNQQNYAPGSFMPVGGMNHFNNDYNMRSLLNKVETLWNRSAEAKNFGEAQWISLEKFFGRDFQTNISFGNVWRDRFVKNIENPLHQQLVLEIDRKLEENKKRSMQIDNINREIEKAKEISKNTLEETSKEALLFHLKIKNYVGAVDEQKKDILQYYEMTKIFDSFSEVLRKGMIQTIDVPSPFLFRSIEKLKAKLEQLVKVVQELDFLSNNPDFKDDSRTKYEFFLKILDNFFQYFKIVSAKVINFNEKLNELKRKMLEQNISLSNRSLEETLNAEIHENKSATIIASLKFIIEKIEKDKLQRMLEANSHSLTRRQKAKDDLLFSFKS